MLSELLLIAFNCLSPYTLIDINCSSFLPSTFQPFQKFFFLLPSSNLLLKILSNGEYSNFYQLSINTFLILWMKMQRFQLLLYLNQIELHLIFNLIIKSLNFISKDHFIMNLKDFLQSAADHLISWQCSINSQKRIWLACVFSVNLHKGFVANICRTISSNFLQLSFIANRHYQLLGRV